MTCDRTVVRALLCLFLAGATACSDDERGGDRERAGGTGVELRCAYDVLESDLESAPWAGPAVDPTRQELKLEGRGPYVVSSTYGTPQRDENGENIARYEQMIGAVQAQLQIDPGLLAVQLSASVDCGSGRTLAVWRSEEQMYEFVTSPAHLAAMSAVDELLQPGYAVTHWEAASPEQITLAEAVRQLAKVSAR